MFKAIFDNLRFLFTFVEEVRRLRSEQKELRQAVEDMEKGYLVLSGAVREIAKDFSHLKESEQHEREKLLLRLENELLKFERRLPSSPDQK
jgi:hypothetical protein